MNLDNQKKEEKKKRKKRQLNRLILSIFFLASLFAIIPYPKVTLSLYGQKDFFRLALGGFRDKKKNDYKKISMKANDQWSQSKKIISINKVIKKNGLQILHVSPKGPTRTPQEAERIVVIFDRPMIPLQTLISSEEQRAKESAASPLPLRIEPKISGKYRWLGTRTLVFTPDHRFPFSTRIKVSIPASTTALDGQRLGDEYSWEFETIRPALIYHRPENEDLFVSLQPEILLVFNQPMDAAKAAPYIFWESTSSNKEEKIVFKISHPATEKVYIEEEEIELPSEYALLLQPVPEVKLKPETEYQITLEKGLPGKEGPLGLEKKYSFTFQTFNYFRFEGIIQTSRKQRIIETSLSLPLSKIFSPDEAIAFKFSNPVSYKEFVSKIKFKPEVEIPEYYFAWEEESPLLYLSLPLSPETQYEVFLPADLTDKFGHKLGENYHDYFFTSPYPPSINMTTGYGLIEAYIQPSPRYFLTVVNQKRVFLQVARLLPENIIPLVKQSDLFRADKSYLGVPGFYQVEKIYNFDLPPNKKQIMPLNLADLHPSFKQGFLFLQVDKGGDQDQWERYLKVLLQITELGLSAKFSSENILIWVTELKTGLPVSGAQLTIRDEHNQVRWQGKTDKNGQAQAPGWKRLGLTLEAKTYRPPRLWVFAQRGEDVAFVSSDWDHGIDPFRFHIPFDWQPEPARFQAHIFTERGIYRAGEEVHIKGVIRENARGEWQIPTAFRSLNLEIIDPLGQIVFKSPVNLDDFGSFNLDYKSSEESSLGLYQIKATVPQAKEFKGQFYGSFRIEAFRPVNFEVHLRTEKASFIFGDEFRATLRANYLFGGAMAGQDLEWSLHFQPASFSPPGHRGFIFGNHIDWDKETITYEEESRLVASQKGRLDAEGKAVIKLPLIAEKEKDSVQVLLEATVTGPDRISVSNRLSTIIHRGEFYIGLKPSTSFLKKGEPITVDIIATSAEGKLIAGRKINLKLIRRQWRSIRQASVGGRWRWRSEHQDTEIDSREVISEDQPIALTFKPDKAGFYYFLASSYDDRHNPITTSTFFYVSGADYVAWEQREDDTIELIPDASNYRPGEICRILVQSPYERAKALITIEREFILDAKVIDIIGTASTIEIPIKPEYIPNVFVSVLLVQGRRTSPADSRDLGMPSFKIGYSHLKVDPAEKKLEIEFAGLKSEYKPQEKVDLKLTVKSKGNPVSGASVALACVDVGVLNLIGYELPDLFSFFYGPRPLSVRTSETRIHLVNQYQLGEKGEEPGGGGEKLLMAMTPSMAEILLRGDFKFTAFWHPTLITNEEGEATVSFNLPDNLTSFLVVAIAQTKDSCFGRGEASFKVAKKLMLQPSLPRFCRVGDEFEAGVIVHNFSPKSGEVRLNFDGSGLTLLDKIRERRFLLQAGESREILFRLKAEQAGQANLAFRAIMDQETDGLQLKIPIKLPRSLETVALSGELNKEDIAKLEEKLIFPDKIFPEFSSLEIQAASSALLGLKGAFDSLQAYPYECLEQKVSALLPYLVAKKLILDFNLSPLNDQEIRDLIRQRLKEIYAYQKENGGFAAWPDIEEASAFLTCYATLALIKAREAGFDIKPQAISKASDYLLSFLRSDQKINRQLYSLRTFYSTQAYALYILSLLNRPQLVFMQKLYEQRDNLSLFGRACLLKAIIKSQAMQEAKDVLIKEFLNKIKFTLSEAHFEDDEGQERAWIFSSSGRTTAIIFQTLLEAGFDHPSLAAIARWLINRQMAIHRGTFLSTQENFYLFWALNDFYRLRPKETVNFVTRFRLADKLLFEAKFSPKDKEIETTRLNLMELARKFNLIPGRVYPLQLEKEGSGILYYGFRLNYVPATPLWPRDEGLAIVKKIEPLERKNNELSTDQIKAGSLVVVTLEISVPQELLYVVVDDPLPAGFEAVNPAFQTESEEAWRKLRALVEDESAEDTLWPVIFNHIERHDDRVILFADFLTPGVHVHRYLARALNFGNYGLPGTKVEQMYAPEVFGRSSEKRIKIVK